MITFKLITTVILSFVVAACGQMTAQSRARHGPQCRSQRHVSGRRQRLASPVRLPARHSSPGEPLHRIHRSSRRRAPNPLTGKDEPNGTVIVDVTDPRVQSQMSR